MESVAPSNLLTELNRHLPADGSGPDLLLGTFERVGSNWLLDALRRHIPHHNEPFRQQLHPSHPLSPRHHRFVPVDEYEPTDALERHYLLALVLSKYNGRQFVKETNLFFSLTNVLAFFPHSRVVLLTRAPTAIVGSFMRRNLERRWSYDERYRQVSAVARSHDSLSAYQWILPEQPEDYLERLTRMLVLNCVLLVERLSNRPHLSIRHEDALHSPTETAERLRCFLGLEGVDLTTEPGAASVRLADRTFTTTGVPDDVFVPEPARARIARLIERLLFEVGDRLGEQTASSAEQLLWEPLPKTLPRKRIGGGGVTGSRRAHHPAPLAARPFQPASSELAPTLVTNAEYCAFLNEFELAGGSNVVGGMQLLLNEGMPASRGGRILRPNPDSPLEVFSGYEGHPVYWVTWLGACAFARRYGGALPCSEDLFDLQDPALVDDRTNIAYRVGDVVDVTDGPRHLGMHHPVGNLQIWCSDGPTPNREFPVNRYFFGLAWNSPMHCLERPLIGCRPQWWGSRSIGIRLVRHSERLPLLEPQTLAERLAQLARRIQAHGSSALTACDTAAADLLLS